MPKEKKKKDRCSHGLSPVNMQGCPDCVMLAMGAFRVCRDNGINEGAELYMILRYACEQDPEKFKALLEKARKEIAQIREKQKESEASISS